MCPSGDRVTPPGAMSVSLICFAASSYTKFTSEITWGDKVDSTAATGYLAWKEDQPRVTVLSS